MNISSPPENAGFSATGPLASSLEKTGPQQKTSPFANPGAQWQRLSGVSAAMHKLESAIHRVAEFGCPVLVTGETGCGKEEVARAIHASGQRRDKPFVVVNCGSLVASLAESQLFGHERGAFTGASAHSLGAFRAAAGGILFLDEIGEMPLELQPKLLRVLQRCEVTPVGSTEAYPVDLQIIAATNRDLELEVAEQRFREDLLYRLNTIHLAIPPLRARPEDIPRFLEHFSAHFAHHYGMPQWLPDAMLLQRLQAYEWPGNVRQLVQFVQRLYVFGDRAESVLADLFRDSYAPAVEQQSPSATASASAGLSAAATPAVPAGVRAAGPSVAGAAGAMPGRPVGQEAASGAFEHGPAPALVGQTAAAAAVASEEAELKVPVFNLAELRRLAVRQALAACDGHRGQAAALLGVSLGTMTRLAEECCPEMEQRTGRKRVGRARNSTRSVSSDV